MEAERFGMLTKSLFSKYMIGGPFAECAASGSEVFGEDNGVICTSGNVEFELLSAAELCELDGLGTTGCVVKEERN